MQGLLIQSDKKPSKYNRRIYDKKYKGLPLYRKTISVDDGKGNQSTIEIHNDKTGIIYKYTNQTERKGIEFSHMLPNNVINAHYSTNRMWAADTSFGYYYDFKKKHFNHLDLTISNDEQLKTVNFIKDGKILNDEIKIYDSKFEYDNSGNWIIENSYENGNLTEIKEREIRY